MMARPQAGQSPRRHRPIALSCLGQGQGELESAKHGDHKPAGIEKALGQPIAHDMQGRYKHQDQRHEAQIGQYQEKSGFGNQAMAPPRPGQQPGQKDRYDDADLEINIPQKDLEGKNHQDLAAHAGQAGGKEHEGCPGQSQQIDPENQGQKKRENLRRGAELFKPLGEHQPHQVGPRIGVQRGPGHQIGGQPGPALGGDIAFIVRRHIAGGDALAGQQTGNIHVQRGLPA